MGKQIVPTSIGTYHNLLDRSRFRLGFETYYDEAYGRWRDGGWFWRPRSCFLAAHMHGPFLTALAAWEDAITNAVTREAA